MGWDSVPWLVGGGAEHSPEVGRLLAYAAMAGNEGIIGSADLRVAALATPGSSVTVAPGACGILCRATSQQYQMYAGRMATQDTVAISATGSGSGRSDLIVARVEDPWLSGEPWDDPANPKVGPYIYTRVIPNVPNTTTTVTGLNLGYSAIPLARIDIPASTATITQAMIVDLRRIANPRRSRQLLVTSPTATQSLTSTAATPADWPAAAVKTVAVPSWAVQAKIVITAAGVVAVGDVVDGWVRSRFGTVFGQETYFDTNGVSGGNGLDKTLMTADVLSVPSSLRGTSTSVALQGRLKYRGSSGLGRLDATTGTTLVADIEFLEVAE
ncbi:hypothetical protein Acy02nite_68500 [Actinoplanes cyaneus]|uniref:Uncharacterized protein n=1 Tax=Actinoplanes cyaneus TaxID=52696 RepID=A0A919IN33_9ACTN|nr:hypothetical protein [Actinoplanes cyaneus]MCW2139101.1 hypothetical protein [Actinoplanes cyaneus]GID68969.1 hypothetical protein Acy02nite_68500 [Actinoplanes cyaneus]